MDKETGTSANRSTLTAISMHGLTIRMKIKTRMSYSIQVSTRLALVSVSDETLVLILQRNTFGESVAEARLTTAFSVP